VSAALFPLVDPLLPIRHARRYHCAQPKARPARRKKPTLFKKELLMLTRIKSLVTGAVVALVVAGCTTNKAPQQSASNAVINAADVGADVKQAVAAIHGTQGNEKVMGVVHFMETGNGVKVTADIDGLAPDSEHGFHIHQFGDCTDPKGMSTGGHYDPEGTKHHGHPGEAMSHVGDMGNIKADDKGHAHVEVTLSTATINGKNGILGRGVIVHEKADNFSQPVGAAGGRIGCGTIGIAQVKQ
jgi:Cu-Zn family superoxide dismutase